MEKLILEKAGSPKASNRFRKDKNILKKSFTDQASTLTTGLLEIIAKAEELLRRQDKICSVNEQGESGSRVKKKNCAAPAET